VACNDDYWNDFTSYIPSVELVDGYIDEFNGDCNDPIRRVGRSSSTSQQIVLWKAGWFMVDGSVFRDTDWFTLTVPASGELVIHGMAQRTSVMYELGPQDLGEVAVLQSAEIYQEGAATLTINGTPGSTVWFWFGAAHWDPPGGQVPLDYTYLLDIPQVVATDKQSWTAVKGLFD
jgi:hypothetical protein